MEAGVNINNMEECPVCLEAHLLSPICPNNHKLCGVCLRHIQSIYNHRYHGAVCPICRAVIPYVPINPVPVNRVPAVDVFGNNTNAGFQDMDVFGIGPGPVITFNIPERRMNMPVLRRNALDLFNQNKRDGIIPENAEFGGTHERKCGHHGCNRTGGSQGVRFLIFGNTGRRRYRCEQHNE